jgi:hypothetical protein
LESFLPTPERLSPDPSYIYICLRRFLARAEQIARSMEFFKLAPYPKSVYISIHRRCRVYLTLGETHRSTPPREISQSQFGRIKKFPFCRACRALTLPENIRPSNPFGIFFISLSLSLSLCDLYIIYPEPRRVPFAYNVLQFPHTTHSFLTDRRIGKIRKSEMLQPTPTSTPN